METTLPAVFNSSSFPSAMNAALTYPFTVSRSILRTITFLCVVDIGAESNRSADCRTFTQNVPQGSYFVAKSSTFVLLFVLRRRRCTWPLSSVERVSCRYRNRKHLLVVRRCVVLSYAAGAKNRFSGEVGMSVPDVWARSSADYAFRNIHLDGRLHL